VHKPRQSNVLYEGGLNETRPLAAAAADGDAAGAFAVAASAYVVSSGGRLMFGD